MKGTLPAVERHPSTEGNCLIYSPIEGGFKGDVPFFCFITFRLFLYFQDRPSCCIAAPDEDENINSGTNLPLSKRGSGGFEFFSYFVIARSVLCDVAISSTHSVIARSILCDVAISSPRFVILRSPVSSAGRRENLIL